MLESLIQADTELFKLINGGHFPFLDYFFSAVSWKHTWVIYLPVFYLLYKKKGLAFTLYALLGLIIIFALSDFFAARFFKPCFERLRPCHNPDLRAIVHIVNNKCGGQYGFVSNHAANHLGIGYFMAVIIRSVWQIRLWWLPLLFAAFVAYSRVYLGVHYPGDVICGGLLGLIISAIVVKVWLKYLLKVTPSS